MKRKLNPFITITIPVRNEGRFIGKTLYQLLKQDYPNDKYEIIVADGNSTDDTAEIVRRLQVHHPQIKLMKNPGQLSSSGRNVGFENGIGDYFVVIDGHCQIPDRNLLKSISEAFQKSGADCLGRPQPFIVPEKPSWQKAITLARKSCLGHSSNSFIHSDIEGFVSPVSVGCAYSRHLFKKIGYVDEKFDACEDVEYNYRVEKAGFKTFFSPSIAVCYFARESLVGLWRQLRRYGEGRMRFIFKHPETFNIDMMLPLLFVLFHFLGPFTFLIHNILLYTYLFILLLYIIILLVESIKIRNDEKLIFIFKLVSVFFVIHFSLSYGFLKGLVKNVIRIKRKY